MLWRTLDSMYYNKLSEFCNLLNYQSGRMLKNNVEIDVKVKCME